MSVFFPGFLTPLVSFRSSRPGVAAISSSRADVIQGLAVGSTTVSLYEGAPALQSLVIEVTDCSATSIHVAYASVPRVFAEGVWTINGTVITFEAGDTRYTYDGDDGSDASDSSAPLPAQFNTVGKRIARVRTGTVHFAPLYYYQRPSSPDSTRPGRGG